MVVEVISPSSSAVKYTARGVASLLTRRLGSIFHLSFRNDKVLNFLVQSPFDAVTMIEAGRKTLLDEMIHEMNHILTADMKSSEAMIIALMTAVDFISYHIQYVINFIYHFIH